MTNHEMDPGVALVRDLFARTQTDEQWSIRDERGFTWWPYRLAQRVWATSPSERGGLQVCQVHIETDLLKGVSDEKCAMATLKMANSIATLSSCVLVDGHVRLHASVSVHRDNLVAARYLATHALNLQLADSYRLLSALVRTIAATADFTCHPDSGARDTPDDMLNVGSLYTNGDAEFASRLGFQQLADDPQRCWAHASAGGDAFTAELRMTRDALPAILCGAGRRLETALFEARVRDDHPQWGIGVATRLRLPCSEQARQEVANYLNVMETLSPDCHQLGGWWVNKDSLQFSTFIPSKVFRDPEDAAPLFLGFVWHQASRAFWANTVLTPTPAKGLQ